MINCFVFFCSKGPEKRKFVLHSWLANEETEVQFLRKLCDALLILLLPSHYRGCISIRHLLREIITSSGTSNVYNLCMIYFNLVYLKRLPQ